MYIRLCSSEGLHTYYCMYVTMFMVNIAHDQYSRYVRVSCMLGKETNVTRHVSASHGRHLVLHLAVYSFRCIEFMGPAL